MTRDPGTLALPRRWEPDASWPSPPVLIQVPALSGPGRRSAAVGVPFRARTGLRRRRRLRREVRVAGSAVLLGLPLVWGTVAVWADRPVSLARPEPPPPRVVILHPAVALDELIPSPAAAPDPAPTASVSASAVREAGAPVVLPGYVLPAEGLEEAVHAGG